MYLILRAVLFIVLCMYDLHNSENKTHHPVVTHYGDSCISGFVHFYETRAEQTCRQWQIFWNALMLNYNSTGLQVGDKETIQLWTYLYVTTGRVANTVLCGKHFFLFRNVSVLRLVLAILALPAVKTLALETIL